MKKNPRIQLTFDGECETAFRFYEQCLNGKITFMLTWGKSPMAAQAPASWGNKIVHATLQIGDTAIMGTDVPPGGYVPPRGFRIDLPMTDPAETARLFEVLSRGGRVVMPLQETFWASRYGETVDRFGIPWSVNCEQPFAPTP